MSTELSTLLQLGTAVLVGFGVWFLQDIRTQLRDMRKEIEEKVDIKACEGTRKACLPGVIFRHTHSGLPEGSEVVLKGGVTS
jgi:hypothetical protein